MYINLIRNGMKKKSEIKKNSIKLDLEKIDIDVLTNSMLSSLQGGYQSQNVGGNTCCISVSACTVGPQSCTCSYVTHGC
jgi:hypothetical protein